MVKRLPIFFVLFFLVSSVFFSYPSYSVASTPAPSVYSSAQSRATTVVVNKKHSLRPEYVPALTTYRNFKMRKETATALAKLFSSAGKAGIQFKIISAYRSYPYQKSLYAKYAKSDGVEKADTYSARAGHSEHQTGLAIDLGQANGKCGLKICFGQTSTGIWLSKHAPEFGFIIRYEKGKEEITGYQYEPWHIRYVGDVAPSIVESGKTLDEYFGVSAGVYVK